LATYGLINPPTLGQRFITQYEYARFSTHPLTESEFRGLMAMFADILNGMTELDPEIVERIREESDGAETRSLSSLGSSGSSTSSALPYRTPRMQSRAEYFETSKLSSSQRDLTESPQTAWTAPSIPRTHASDTYDLPRTPSEASIGSGSVRVRPVQRSPSTILPNSSSSSLRSGRSVIRLRPNRREGDLPYQYLSDDA
jgi:hypothetical protein